MNVRTSPPRFSIPARLPLVLSLMVLAGLALVWPSSLADIARAQGNLECSPARDKTAAPGTVNLGEQVTVTLEISGTCPSQTRKVDVVLVIDRSSSMSVDDKLNHAKRAANAFVDNIDPALVQIGVVAFDDVIEEMIGLTNDEVQLKQAVDDIQWNWGTNLVDSLEAARRMLNSAAARPDAAHVIVFMTDGRHSVGTRGNPGPPITAIFPIILQTQADGIVVYTVGLGQDVDQPLLEQVAGDPDRYYFSPDGTALQDVYLKIAGRLEAKVLFKTIVIDDVVPANMKFIVGSTNPPAVWNAGTRTLTWTLIDVAEAGRTLKYRVEPLEAGTHPTNVIASARYTDGFDNEGDILFPVPEVTVLVDEVPPPPGDCVCRITRQKAPQEAIDHALANPERIMGWNLLTDQGKPGSPPYPTPGHDWPPNPRRTCLDILNRAVHYHPLFNSVIWRAGCLEGPARP